MQQIAGNAIMSKIAVTRADGSNYQKFYDHANKHLFNDRLTPYCKVTDSARGNTDGHFTPGELNDRTGGFLQAHIIALNPHKWTDKTDIQIFADLVANMVHLEQNDFGKPSRPGYHNEEYAELMQRVGLMTSHNGKPGGYRTGPDKRPGNKTASYYIVTGGILEQVWKKLKGAKWKWQAQPKRTCKSPTKYTCEICGDNVWGKPNLRDKHCSFGHPQAPMLSKEQVAARELGKQLQALTQEGLKNSEVQTQMPRTRPQRSH
jgi:hypothetical protein